MSFAEFKIDCPRCKAPDHYAQLEIVSGKFKASGMSLRPDGFATMDARCFDTDEEMVHCHACGQTFPLGECVES